MNDVTGNTTQSTGKRTIRKLQVRNLFSFGEKGIDLDLLPLNVLIGANNTGKSNLINVLRLISALPRGFSNTVARLGGSGKIIFKGPGTKQSHIDLLFSADDTALYRYHITIEQAHQIDFQFIEERLSTSNNNPVVLLDVGKSGFVTIYDETTLSPEKRRFQDVGGIHPAISVINDPYRHSFLLVISNILSNIQIIRAVDIVGSSKTKDHQNIESISEYLFGDGSNLAVVLNKIQMDSSKRKSLIDNIKKINPLIDHVGAWRSGQLVEILIHEKGLNHPIPANRLSDGTLSFLALLAVLLNPSPPPLICIEEPEIGLHPDMMRTVATLLKEASQRSQIIVTTHSEMLVSALSDMPEAVVVCERDEEGSHFRRLEPEKLEEWLKKYTLGDLWAMGEIGGTRW